MVQGDLKRDGINITSSLTISLAQALHGGKVKLNTVDGKMLITIPPKTRNGQNLD
jgi:DnaJ-class molecular chaperone